MFEEREDEVLRMTAEIFADRVEKAAGGLIGLIVIPMATVTLVTGLTRTTVPLKMKVVKSGGKSGVTIQEITRYIREREQPIQKRKEKRGAA
jgi:hypothetical protein